MVTRGVKQAQMCVAAASAVATIQSSWRRMLVAGAQGHWSRLGLVEPGLVVEDSGQRSEVAIVGIRSSTVIGGGRPQVWSPVRVHGRPPAWGRSSRLWL
jgi:hypothetical protein